ncbi:hypothetical protein Tco_0140357 [Tanacetum coccineum]
MADWSCNLLNACCFVSLTSNLQCYPPKLKPESSLDTTQSHVNDVTVLWLDTIYSDNPIGYGESLKRLVLAFIHYKDFLEGRLFLDFSGSQRTRPDVQRKHSSFKWTTLLRMPLFTVHLNRLERIAVAAVGKQIFRILFQARQLEK